MLYQQKIGAYVEEISPEKEKIFSRGKRWEPVVIEMLVDELQSRGHTVEVLDRNQRYTDAEHDFLKAEIDLELLIDGEEVNGEMKTVHPFAAKDWGKQESDEIPVYYYAQVMHGLMIKPRKKAVIAALIGADDLRVHWVNRDEETIAGIREKEIEFWRRVQEQDSPDPTESDDVKWLYKTDSGEATVADYEIFNHVEKLKDLKARSKDTDGLIEVLSTKIKAYMGDAATLLYEGRPLLTWKNNRDSVGIDWKAIVEELNPASDIIAAHTTTLPGSRVFRLK
jgi:predicted phage-related endonuclease